jgi:hypothetical protein
MEDGGLALEERLTPPPIKVVPPLVPEPPLEIGGGPSFEAATVDPFAFPGRSFDPAGLGAFDPAARPGDEPLALAGETPAPEPAIPHPPAEPVQPARRPAAPPAPTEPAPHPAAAQPPIPPPPMGPRPPLRPPSPIRALAINALALASLLLVAVFLLALWRSEGPLEAASFRPAAILGALRGGDAADGPFVVSEVRSGVYERARGAPVVFVRGKVVSRAPQAVAALGVSVALVRAGSVLARGESVAGAVPTPEELHAATDAAALERAWAVARTRAPAAVQPGDAVPFLVAIADPPADLEGATIRVAVAPAGRPRP